MERELLKIRRNKIEGAAIELKIDPIKLEEALLRQGIEAFSAKRRDLKIKRLESALSRLKPEQPTD